MPTTQPVTFSGRIELRPKKDLTPKEVLFFSTGMKFALNTNYFKLEWPKKTEFFLIEDRFTLTVPNAFDDQVQALLHDKSQPGMAAGLGISERGAAQSRFSDLFQIAKMEKLTAIEEKSLFPLYKG